MLIRFAKRVFPVQKPAFKLAFRSFSVSENNGQYEEPDFLVKPDEYLEDTSVVKIPYIREEARIDMYMKFLSDPKKWHVNALASLYGAHPFRVKGILTLMEKRFEKYKELGFEISSTGEPIVPPAWQKLHDLRTENPTMPLSDLSAAAGMPEGTSDEELNRVIKVMFEHSWRQANLDDFLEDMKRKLSEYEDTGVNTDFHEDLGKSGSKFDNYFPALLGDEVFEEEKKRLLKRIEQETKAVKIRDFDYYVRKHSEVPVKVVNSEGIEELSPTETEILRLEDIVAPAHDNASVKHFSRFKYAFRDLSFMNYKGKRGALSEEDPALLEATAEKDKDGNVKPLPRDTRRRKSVASFAAPPATMMLSRGGFWRQANPLEESQRSWTRSPTHLDLLNPASRAKVQKYGTDWDGDLALVARQREARKQRRQALLEAAGIKK